MLTIIKNSVIDIEITPSDRPIPINDPNVRALVDGLLNFFEKAHLKSFDVKRTQNPFIYEYLFKSGTGDYREWSQIMTFDDDFGSDPKLTFAAVLWRWSEIADTRVISDQVIALIGRYRLLAITARLPENLND